MHFLMKDGLWDLSQAKCAAMHTCETSNFVHDNTTTLEPYKNHLGFSLSPSDSIRIGNQVKAKCKIEGKIFKIIVQ